MPQLDPSDAAPGRAGSRSLSRHPDQNPLVTGLSGDLWHYSGPGSGCLLNFGKAHVTRESGMTFPLRGRQQESAIPIDSVGNTAEDCFVGFAALCLGSVVFGERECDVARLVADRS